MPFVRPTLQEIITRVEQDMVSRLTGNLALLRRGVLRVLARIIAGASHIMYGFFAFLIRQLFVTDAETEWLDRHGRMWGINRKASTFSTGVVRFTGIDTTVIPSGIRVQTDAGIELETTALGTISGGIADIPWISVEAGSAGNLAVSTIVELIEAITDVDDTATITVSNGDGDDLETDDEYRARILFRIQEPPMGGNRSDYIAWAEEVSGVDKAWCFPVTPGPGQVTVAFKGSASVGTVEPYIAARMPVTADLIVVKVIDVSIDFTIKIEPNTAANQSAITSNLGIVFDESASPGALILFSEICNAISTTGVGDFFVSSIAGTIRDSYGNLQFSGFDYGVLGTITFQDL